MKIIDFIRKRTFCLLYRLHLKSQNYSRRVFEKELRKEFKSIGDNASFELSTRLVKGLEYVTIGNNFYGHENLWLGVYKTDDYLSPEITIGNDVCINYDCQITAINKIIIGDNVLFGSRVLVTDHTHGNTNIESLKTEPLLRPLVSKGPVVIEKNVLIGAGVVILAGVTIGNNAVIGANSTVTRDVRPYAVVYGSPVQQKLKNR